MGLAFSGRHAPPRHPTRLASLDEDVIQTSFFITLLKSWPMATESKSVDIGFPCPDFRLPSVTGSTVARDDYEDAPVLGVFFTCNHCPYAKAIEPRLLELEKDYRDKGFRF